MDRLAIGFSAIAGGIVISAIAGADFSGITGGGGGADGSAGASCMALGRCAVIALAGGDGVSVRTGAVA